MISAIIVSGGEGTRFGRSGGKQVAEVVGDPVVAHTLRAFADVGLIGEIVLVAHPDRVEEYRAHAIEAIGADRLAAVIPGGDSRQQSVANGLAAVSASADVVVVHDGARPLITSEVIERALAALDDDQAADGVVVGHPVYDTVKRVAEDGTILSTEDRSALWAAQTPQVFRATALREAYARASTEGFTGTDDASLVERCGATVRMVPGPRENIKVTTPEDLRVVEAVMRLRGDAE